MPLKSIEDLAPEDFNYIDPEEDEKDPLVERLKAEAAEKAAETLCNIYCTLPDRSKVYQFIRKNIPGKPVKMIFENGKWEVYENSLVLYTSIHCILYVYRDCFKKIHLVSYEGYPEWVKDPYKATINARKKEFTFPLGEDLNLLKYLNDFVDASPL